MLPKLERMSLRTMPVSASALATVPAMVLEPSAGNGPSVSSAVTAQLPVLVVEPLEPDELLLDELLESLDESLPPPPHPHAASSVVAARPAAPRRTRRRPSGSRSWARPLS